MSFIIIKALLIRSDELKAAAAFVLVQFVIHHRLANNFLIKASVKATGTA